MAFPSSRKRRASRRAELSLDAAWRAMKNVTTIVCGDGRHHECKAGYEQCLCSCHDEPEAVIDPGEGLLT